MQYKSNKSMVSQHLGLIAGQQHHALGIRNSSGVRSRFQKPLEFDIWFLKGVRYYETKGYEFKFLTDGLVRISKAGKSNLRTISDFEREHEEYKNNFYL